MKQLLCLFLIVISFGTAAQSFDKAKLDEFVQLLDDHQKTMMSVAIIDKGQPVYQRSIGFTDVKAGTKPNSETQYRIGSITKVYTATMIFQLIEEGKLSLDTPLAAFYPKVKYASDITISMLLSHRSGIHNFTALPEYPSLMTKKMSKADMLMIIEHMDSDFTPGSKALYSNSGYLLLGYILEDVTGDTFANQLQKRITDKLGLSRTAYGREITPEQNQARSYQFQNGTWYLASETDMSVPHGAGAIISTPTEVALFLIRLFEGKLLSAASLAKMTEINEGFGRGIFQFPFNGKQAYGHTGSIDGFSSQGVYFDRDDVAVVITSNGTNFKVNDISIGVLSIYFGMPYELPDFSKQAITLSAEQLRHYQGVFTSDEITLSITLSIDGNQLTAQATGQRALPLTPFSDSEFRFEPAGIIITFEQNDGEVDYHSFTLNQGGRNLTFVKD